MLQKINSVIENENFFYLYLLTQVVLLQFRLLNSLKKYEINMMPNNLCTLSFSKVIFIRLYSLKFMLLYIIVEKPNTTFGTCF